MRRTAGSTFGDPRGITGQNDAQQKAHILAPHAAVLIAGAGEVGSLLIHETRQQLAGQNLDGGTNVMNALREHSRTRYNEWFETVPAIVPQQLAVSVQTPIRPELAFVVAGYDVVGYDLTPAPTPTPVIYTVASQLDFSPMLHNYGFAVQGVGQYALYLLNRLYQPNRSVNELAALAVYTVTERASQDGKVGGPAKVITIKPGEDGASLLSPADVQAIPEQNELRSAALRDSFYQASGE